MIRDDYRDRSKLILGGLGVEFKDCRQNDIKIKEINKSLMFLVRSIDDHYGISIKYGLRFSIVNDLLSKALNQWMKGRQNVFAQPWACIYWSSHDSLPLILNKSEIDQGYISLSIDNILASLSLRLDDCLRFAWENRLVDGISRYQWPAACLINKQIGLYHDIVEFFSKSHSEESVKGLYYRQIDSIHRTIVG